MSAEEVRIKELEDQLNESQIREKEKDERLKALQTELDWVMEQYSNLMNGSFSEMFDLCAKIKSLALDKLLEKRNMQPPQNS